jgi:hypothetical protein
MNEFKLLFDELFDNEDISQEVEKTSLIRKNYGEFCFFLKYGVRQHYYGYLKALIKFPVKFPVKFPPSIRWLKYMAFKKNIYIQHAGNEGEYQIPGTPFRADGYCKKTNEIYEFHGCFFHGCQICYSACYRDDKLHKTMGEIYEDTIIRERIIMDLGYNLVTMWNHDWRKFIKIVIRIQRNFRKKHYTNLDWVIYKNRNCASIKTNAFPEGINQYDKDDKDKYEILCTFNTCREAAEFVKLKYNIEKSIKTIMKKIRRVCRGVKRIAYEYQWGYEYKWGYE